MDDNKKQEMPIPRTVGEMIEFLQKFPKDRILDLYYMEQYSLRLDVQLMLLTLKIIFTKESTEGVKEDGTDPGIDSNTGS